MNAIKSNTTIWSFIGSTDKEVCNEELRESLKDACDALDKQIPAFPNIDNEWGDYHCPVCGKEIYKQNYCSECGKAIRWV